MSGADQPTLRLRDHRPEPANLWIRHSAVVNPPEDTIWLDPIRLDIGGFAEQRGREGRRFEAPEDLLWVPPSAAGDERRGLIDWCVVQGRPALVHWVVGGDQSFEAFELATPLVDPLSVLLERRLEALTAVPAAGTAIWPVLPGVTDGEQLVDDGLRRLRRAGIETVVPLAVEVSPRAARHLTEQFGEHLFASLFHAVDEVDVRPVARACRQLGLDFLPSRPELPGGRLLERRLATEMALIGDLWLAVERSPARAQEFFRAAAWMEATRHDVAGLLREGNLTIVPVVTEDVRTVIEELAGGSDRSRLLRQLERKFVGVD